MLAMNPKKKFLLINRETRLAPALLSALLVLGIMGLLPLTACRKSQVPETKAAAGIHKTVEKGPVSVAVDASRSAITVADRLEMKITLLAPAGYEGELPDKLPESKDKTSAFSVVEAGAPSVEMPEDSQTCARQVRIRRTYVLEPFLAGAYTIPSMPVRFWKAGDQEKTNQTISTPAIPVTVTSVLPDKSDGAGVRPHDIRPPVSLPPSIAIWIWTAVCVAGLLLAGLGGFLIIRRRRNARLINAEMVIPPHEAAFSALDQLMAAQLIEKGEIKVFYQEISGILRRYIEARFGLRAPEQTTEEFLDGLKTGAALDIRYQGLLKQFLTHCDLVKFAAHLPSGEDIRNTIDSCRTFVQETRKHETDI